MKKLICITGKDGTGKSTQIDMLKKEYPHAFVSEIWDLLKSPQNKLMFNSKKDIDEYLCGLTPNSRMLFLMHALKFSVDRAMESDAGIVLLNAYHYKYLASEIALGADLELAKALANSFPKPDLIIELSLNSSVAAQRKQRFSKYECGANVNADKHSFISFQEKTTLKQSFFTTNNWQTITSDLQIEDTFIKVLAQVERLIEVD